MRKDKAQSQKDYEKELFCKIVKDTGISVIKVGNDTTTEEKYKRLQTSCKRYREQIDKLRDRYRERKMIFLEREDEFRKRALENKALKREIDMMIREEIIIKKENEELKKEIEIRIREGGRFDILDL